MDDSTRLCQKDTHTTSSLVSASSTIPIIGNDEENLNTSLIQDPIQVLELELMHAIPKDPVLETMFRHFESHIPDDKRVATCLKLNYIKLAAAHAMKEAENQDADLVLALQNLDVNNTECTIHTKDTPLKKAINAFRALAQKHKRVRKSSAFKLQQFIRDSGAQVPKVYQRMNLDDLSAVWYAINSDRHYICSESLDLCHPHEFQVFLITHLHLVGGTPSHRQMLKKPKYTTYQQFLALLPDLLNKARCNQPGRLGYSTKAPTTGPWLYQYAASLEALDVDRWEVLCEETYEVMRRDTDQVIFVIHVSHSIYHSIITALCGYCSVSHTHCAFLWLLICTYVHYTERRRRAPLSLTLHLEASMLTFSSRLMIKLYHRASQQRCKVARTRGTPGLPLSPVSPPATSSSPYRPLTSCLAR
jgi:hypothetical protein